MKKYVILAILVIALGVIAIGTNLSSGPEIALAPQEGSFMNLVCDEVRDFSIPSLGGKPVYQTITKRVVKEYKTSLYTQEQMDNNNRMECDRLKKEVTEKCWKLLERSATGGHELKCADCPDGYEGDCPETRQIINTGGGTLENTVTCNIAFGETLQVRGIFSIKYILEAVGECGGNGNLKLSCPDQCTPATTPKPTQQTPGGQEGGGRPGEGTGGKDLSPTGGTGK